MNASDIIDLVLEGYSIDEAIEEASPKNPLRMYKLSPWPRYSLLYLMNAFQDKFGYHVYNSTDQTIGVEDKDLSDAKKFVTLFLRKDTKSPFNTWTLTKAK